MPGEDNKKAPEHIRKLFGKPVYVNAWDSSRWKGLLSAYHEGPVIVVSGCSYAGTGGGMNEGNQVFPADWQIEEREVPPPPEPCPACGQTPWNLSLNWG